MNRENAERLMAYKREEAMEKAKKDTANNPINSYTHGFADGYSKGFISAIELLMRNEEIWKEISEEESEYKIKNDPQISPCIRKKCSDPATCCGCEDYQRWIDEVNKE